MPQRFVAAAHEERVYEIDVEDAISVAQRGTAFSLEGDPRCICNIVEVIKCPSCVLDGLGHGLVVCDVDGRDVLSTVQTWTGAHQCMA